MRPVVEMQFDAFAYPAFEQIVCTSPRCATAPAARLTLPMVIRVPYAGGIGGVEHHCDSSEAYYAHTPGLKVVTPATVADAYALLREAIAVRDPVVFLEPKKLYWSQGRGRTLAGRRTEPIGRRGRAAQPGTDATLIAYGPVRAGRAGGRRGGRARRAGTCEVVDLRTLVPFDDETVVRRRSARTGRAVVVAEAHGFAGGRPRRSPPGSRSAASTHLARADPAGRPASTSRTRRRSSSTTTCPAWTGSSTPSTPAVGGPTVMASA